MTTPGERFADAIAAHDVAAMSELLADEVEFRGMTPSTFWEASSPAEVVEVVLGDWFTETDHIVAASRAEADPVSDTRHVGYRFDIDNEDGARVVEQQAYYRDEDGRIVWMRIVCSGYRDRE